MPQYTTPPKDITPFGQVLIDYMWNKRPRNSPPMSYGQLAIRLGVPKQSVSNWILRHSVPPLDTIMAILKRLDIPLRDLYDAYAQAELPIPAWDAADLAQQQTTLSQQGEDAADQGDEPIVPRSRKPATAPMQAEAPTPPTAQPTTQPPTAQQASRIVAPKPLPYTPPSEPYDRESLMAADEKKLIAQTREALREVGASDELIANAIAHIQAHRQQTPTSREQHILAEHSEPSTEPSAGSASATSASESEIASTPDSSVQRTTQRPTQRSSRR